MISELLKAYLISQKITSPFLWVNVFDYLIYIILGYLFVWKYEYGLYGYALIKIIVEIINLVLY